MRLSQPSISLAASLALFSATQAAAGPLCNPVLSLRDVRTSEAHEMQRTWTGVLLADASRCSDDVWAIRHPIHSPQGDLT